MLKPHQKIAFAVTSWFECGDDIWGISGNFDGMGLSFGPRQNNFGCGSLQPLLKKADALGLISKNFTADQSKFIQSLLIISSKEAQTQIVVRDMNDDRGRIKPEWLSSWKSLAEDPTMQAIVMDDTEEAMKSADELSQWIGGKSQTVRCYCLAYDIVNQCGGISSPLRMLLTSLKPLLYPFSRGDRDWMLFIAWARGMWTDFRGTGEWADDVVARKRAIVKGKLRFRGERIDLDTKFQVSDTSIQI